ncbi:MAG: HAD-IIA family hydrolase [Rectinema subterraneum]|jgi:NagD protein|nr:TIGR01457 family HAD-type hydrolase [Spirochaetaceae bacterium]
MKATEETLKNIRKKQAFIIDMDGVIYHGNVLLPGAAQFVDWLRRQKKRFLFLTNSSERSPEELSQKMARLGIDVGPGHFYSSALATAAFLANQKPNGSAYVIGEPGLIHALYRVGYTMNNINPDYVVVGEASSYNLDTLIKAVRLVIGGAKLIGTNPDLTGPGEGGLVPACGALVAPIELATGRKAYFVGKPNPLMMRHALRTLGATREETVIIGDRMDTDIIAGIESQIETVLVLTGVTARQDLPKYAYAPDHVLEGIFEIPEATEHTPDEAAAGKM